MSTKPLTERQARRRLRELRRDAVPIISSAVLPVAEPGSVPVCALLLDDRARPDLTDLFRVTQQDGAGQHQTSWEAFLTAWPDPAIVALTVTVNDPANCEI